MSPHIRASIAALFLAMAWPGLATAGMPSLTVADVGRTLSLSASTRARIEAISFFLAGLLVCAWVVRGLWNGLRKDFPRLPWLSYGKALGVVILWGLLFVLVLTMISGTRELMTPGAWERSGWTCRLANDPAEAASRQIAARHEAMERLRDALLRHADEHGGSYPACPPDATLPEPLRKVPVFPGQRYVYLGGERPADELGWDSPPLLYEADTFGPDRLAILTDGSILWMPVSQIERAARPRTP